MRGLGEEIKMCLDDLGFLRFLSELDEYCGGTPIEMCRVVYGAMLWRRLAHQPFHLAGRLIV